MNDLLPALGALLAVPVGWAVYRWVYRKARQQWHQRRSQGYRLVHALTSYSAWLDYLRSEALTSAVQDQFAWPEALLRAREIIRHSFPAMSTQLLQLQEGDSRLMGMMWQQELRRLTEPAELFVHAREPDYQQLREDQEMLIQEMISRCREIIGESVQRWRRTDEEFDFSSGSGYTKPASG